MRVLITGAGGFLGSRLAAFYEKKHIVLGPRHAELDFTDGEQVLETVLDFSPDVIVHCGAISDVGTCEKSPELSMAVNVEGTRNLARASAVVGARFIYCSSDQVYFNQAPETPPTDFLSPHTEDEALSPLPLYGQHKLLAEQACLKEQPDSVILRLTWMYDQLTDRELEKGRSNLAVNLERALRTGTPLTFSPTDHRGVTNVQDVIRQMEQVWKLPAGIYNYGSSNSVNMYETARRILTTLGRPELLKKADGGSLRNLTMDTSKAEAHGILFPDTADGVIQFLKESDPDI